MGPHLFPISKVEHGGTIFTIEQLKKGTNGCLGDLLGMEYCPVIFRDYFINHDIRIPFLNNQDFMESQVVFFFRGSNCHLEMHRTVHVFSGRRKSRVANVQNHTPVKPTFITPVL